MSMWNRLFNNAIDQQLIIAFTNGEQSSRNSRTGQA